MDTATDTTTESRPRAWEPRVHASLIVIRATPIDLIGPRPGLSIGGLTLHLGWIGGDTEVIEVIDRLLEPLQELRSAALRRLAKP